MPSSDSSNNVFGIGGPSEGLGLRIVLGEVAIDRRLEVDNADLLSKRDVKSASSSDARPTIVKLASSHAASSLMSKARSVRVGTLLVSGHNENPQCLPTTVRGEIRLHLPLDARDLDHRRGA